MEFGDIEFEVPGADGSGDAAAAARVTAPLFSVA